MSKKLLHKREDRRIEELDDAMADAETYQDWLTLAAQHDDLTGAAIWRGNAESRGYNHTSIRNRLERLQKLRQEKNDAGLLFALNEGIHGNMAGMGRTHLHERALCGTKLLIENYVDEISESLDHLGFAADKSIPLRKRLEFFHRASHCYGRSALMLSGGGTLGYFHFGVLKALIEQQLCPVVISGASAGAFVAAIVGTRTDTEYLALFENNFLAKAMTENNGNIKIGLGMDEEVDMPAVRAEMAKLIPDMTFLEAFEKTGRSINIAISPALTNQESRLLNHIAAPNVTIRSAVLASSALPGVFPPVRLEAKDDNGEVRPYLPKQRWIDGSFSQDLPAKRLGRMYGVNHFIVSQVMPGLGRNSARKPGLYSIFSDAWIAATKQFTRGSLSAAQRYFRVGPRIGMALNAVNGLIDQQFSGDINIFPPYGYGSLRKLLKMLSEEEMSEIIRAGEHGTWPKLSAIATTTRIGRTLDKVMHHYDQQQVHWLQSAPSTEAFKQEKKAARKPSSARKGASRAGSKKSPMKKTA